MTFFKLAKFVAIANLLLGGAILTGNLVSIDECRGGISLAGCKTCTDQHAHLFECLHYLVNIDPAAQCYTSQCIDNDMIYARCNETPANETGNCPMHTDAMAQVWTQQIFTRDVYPGTCSDSGPGINDPLPAGSKPVDGKCQSPGILFNVGKCFLPGSCGAVAVPGSFVVRQYGRLVCG